MENIIITELSDGYVELKAKEGYQLVAENLERVVSEAVVKLEQINQFKAVKINEE